MSAAFWCTHGDHAIIHTIDDRRDCCIGSRIIPWASPLAPTEATNEPQPGDVVVIMQDDGTQWLVLWPLPSHRFALMNHRDAWDCAQHAPGRGWIGCSGRLDDAVAWVAEGVRE